MKLYTTESYVESTMSYGEFIAVQEGLTTDLNELNNHYNIIGTSQTAINKLQALEGIAETNSPLYDLAMEVITEPLGYTGGVLTSVAVEGKLSDFKDKAVEKAKELWATIVKAFWKAVNYIRGIFTGKKNETNEEEMKHHGVDPEESGAKYDENVRKKTESVYKGDKDKAKKKAEVEKEAAAKKKKAEAEYDALVSKMERNEDKHLNEGIIADNKAKAAKVLAQKLAEIEEEKQRRIKELAANRKEWVKPKDFSLSVFMDKIAKSILKDIGKEKPKVQATFKARYKEFTSASIIGSEYSNGTAYDDKYHSDLINAINGEQSIMAIFGFSGWLDVDTYNSEVEWSRVHKASSMGTLDLIRSTGDFTETVQRSLRLVNKIKAPRGDKFRGKIEGMVRTDIATGTTGVNSYIALVAKMAKFRKDLEKEYMKD